MLLISPPRSDTRRKAVLQKRYRETVPIVFLTIQDGGRGGIGQWYLGGLTAELDRPDNEDMVIYIGTQ